MLRHAKALLGILFTIAMVPTAFGANVLVTNATSGWSVERTTSSATAGTTNYWDMPYDGVTTIKPAVVISPDSHWTAQSDPRFAGANWISDLATSGFSSSDPFSTRYVYKTAFTVSQLSALNLTFAADNLVDHVTLSTAPNGGGTVVCDWANTVLPIGTQADIDTGRINGFRLQNVQSTTALGEGLLYATVTCYNYGGPPTPPNYVDGSSYGFIMTISATPAPEPSALVLLGIPAAGMLLRRRRNS